MSLVEQNSSGIVLIVTGGIASGKSFVMNHIKNYGLLSLDLDQVANQMISQNQYVIDELIKAFPSCTTDGTTINKSLLSQEVFCHPPSLALLNSIMRPRIRMEYDRILNANKGKAMVVEIPLMIEAIVRDNYCYYNDCIILVKAQYKTKLQRILERNNMTKEKFDAIVSSQLPDSVKMRYADHIIENEDSLAVINQIENILRAGFERNSFRYRNHRTESKRWS